MLKSVCVQSCGSYSFFEVDFRRKTIMSTGPEPSNCSSKSLESISGYFPPSMLVGKPLVFLNKLSNRHYQPRQRLFLTNPCISPGLGSTLDQANSYSYKTYTGIFHSLKITNKILGSCLFRVITHTNSHIMSPNLSVNSEQGLQGLKPISSKN